MPSVVLGFIGLVLGYWLFGDADGSVAAGGVLLSAVLGVTFGRVSTLAKRQKNLAKQIEELQNQLKILSKTVSWTSEEPEAAASPEPELQPEPVPVPAMAAEPALPGLILAPPAMAIVPPPAEPAPQPDDAPIPQAWQTPPPATPRRPDFFETQIAAVKAWLLGGNTVARVGAIVLFLGLAFALRYAAERVTIPIELRYAAVAAAGLVLLVIGWRLRETRRQYGLLLQGVATGILYLTIFAAMRLHPLLPPQAGFVLLVALVVFSTLLAVLQDARGLAIAAAAGGFAAPILVPSTGDHHVALLSYLLLLDAGILSVAWFKAWRPLNLIGYFGTLAIGGSWSLAQYQPAMFASIEPFVLLFFLMFVGIGVLFARSTLRDAPSEPPGDDRAALMLWAARQTNALDGILLFGTPLAAFAVQAGLVERYHYGTAFSALGLGLFYIGLAALLRRRAPRLVLALVEVFIALGVVFGTLAIPLALEARWVSAAWAIEGAGVYWIALKQDRRLGRAFAILVQIGAALAYLGTLRPGNSSQWLNGSQLGAVMVAAALIWSFAQLHRRSDRPHYPEDQPLLALFTLGGLFFLALIAPLCFGTDGIVIAWALLGLAALEVSLRLGQRDWLVGSLLLQGAGGLIVLFHLSARLGGVALALFGDGDFWAGALVALSGFFSAWRLFKAARNGSAPMLVEVGFAELSTGLLWWGAILWGAAWFTEISRRVLADTQALVSMSGHPLLDHDAVQALTRDGVPADTRAQVMLLVAALTVFAWSAVARFWHWRAMAVLAATLLPVAILVLAAAYQAPYHPAAHLGWLAWPAVLAIHLGLLRRIADLLPQSWPERLHILGCWLALTVAALEIRADFALLSDQINAWRWLGWASIPALYLAAAAQKRFPAIWPITAFKREYRVIAAFPVALILLAWFWLSALFSDGDASPLPYVPLINPLELGEVFALFALFSWYRARFAELPKVQPVPKSTGLWIAGASVLALATGAVLRTSHHWAGVPFTLDGLLGSMLVQAGLSMVWAITAWALMIFGHARGLRIVWITGAALIAFVVAKLFLVELTNAGGLPRIISFIGVGILLLVTGYFAPLPPKHAATPEPAP